MTNRKNTICAMATPAGGAIGIIRISGDNAINIADKVFEKKGNTKTITDAKGYSLHYGKILSEEKGSKTASLIDEVMLALFRTPHSYTGEDCIEISCHGSAYIMKNILQALIRQGCVMAQPGEFTQRAFLNGKLDLSQAEAVADLIAATNSATHKMAISQLKGNFSDELARLREQLLKLTSLLELELDFSDHEDLEFADRTQLTALSKQIDSRITALAASFASGKAMKEGIAVAIAGKTNVGKSTLLNLLVGEERAIVSDIHGTTRDVIEDTTVIKGVTFRFIDTAGIRDTEDTIEQLGINRTYRKIDEAAIVIWMLDNMPTKKETEDILNLCKHKTLLVVNNKTDITDITPQLSTLFPQTHIIGISAKRNTNINRLRDTIHNAAGIPTFTENDVIITSARHYDSLLKAHESITNVIQALDMNLSGDLISEDLRSALHHLADITGGAITTEETLSNIFQHFCIGK